MRLSGYHWAGAIQGTVHFSINLRSRINVPGSSILPLLTTPHQTECFAKLSKLSTIIVNSWDGLRKRINCCTSNHFLTPDNLPHLSSLPDVLSMLSISQMSISWLTSQKLPWLKHWLQSGSLTQPPLTITSTGILSMLLQLFRLLQSRSKRLANASSTSTSYRSSVTSRPHWRFCCMETRGGAQHSACLTGPISYKR